MEDLKLYVIGKLALQRGGRIPTSMEMRRKLSDFWKNNDLKFISLGKGTFHILLCTLKDQCKALSVSSIFVKPELLRLNRWMLGYNSIKQISISQVWIFVHNPPLEF